jgi:hypothetical protein
MALTAQLTNPSYSYIPGGNATIGCTLNVLGDDGVTVLSTKGMSCGVSLESPDFKELVTASLAQQSQEHIDQLKVVVGLVYTACGTPDFDTAINAIITDTTSRIVI